MSSTRILIELVIVLGSAAITTVLFQALRLPVVLGYVLAGLAIGPHVPLPLVADASLVHVLSELGVILLMFTIGLELPLASIARVGIPSAMIALFEVGLVVLVGTGVARLLGFGAVDAIFAGACLGISSTMLVAKAFDELGWKGGFTEVVFAILVFEDLIAIVLLATLTAVAGGAELDAEALGLLLARLAGFLALTLAGGLLIVPRIFRWIATRARRETLAIAALFACFGLSAIAASAGYSVALGAFIAGVLVAESGHGHAVFSLVEVLRDVFAAVFFVSVGMSIDPSLLGHQWLEIAVFSAVVLVVKPVGVTIAAFLAGRGIRPAVRAGLSLAQIGEFSFVIAGVLASPTLLAIAVGVSCTTTLVSPLVIRNSERVAGWTASRLPKRLATFVSFYESWVDRLRAAGTASGPKTWRRHRRSVVVLAIDAALFVAIVIAGSTIGRRLLADTDLDPSAQTAIAIGAVALAAAPVALGMMRSIAAIARRLANDIIPEVGGVDLGRAARRALVLTLELAVALALVVPIVAIVQSFVPGSFVLILVVAGGLVFVMRSSIADFDGHVRASSEVILEILAQPRPSPSQAAPEIGAILPGFEGVDAFEIPAGSPAVGRSLAELDLRAQTGATVLAIVREGHNMATPSPSEPLQVGDRVALAGSVDAVAAARARLGIAP